VNSTSTGAHCPAVNHTSHLRFIPTYNFSLSEFCNISGSTKFPMLSLVMSI
jgi:hypothetical protein